MMNIDLTEDTKWNVCNSNIISEMSVCTGTGIGYTDERYLGIYLHTAQDSTLWAIIL